MSDNTKKSEEKKAEPAKAPTPQPKAEEKPAGVTPTKAEDKKNEKPVGNTPAKRETHEMSRADGKERIAKLGNSTARTLYDHYVSNGKTPKEAVRLLLTQFGKKK